MGRKEKFVYNIHTLTYEKVVVPFKTRIWQAFGFFSVVIVTSLCMLAVFYSVFPSPRETDLMREISQMESKYKQMSEQVDVMSKVLQNIQDRDANVHRMVFGMDPIDQDVWTAGVGGHEAHPELSAFKYSGASIGDALGKVDMLSRQLSLESKSLDTLQSLAKNQENMLASIPSVKPVREDKLQKSIGTLSGFGYRIHPVYKFKKFHAGLDFPARTGTAIQASGDGTVVETGWHHGYGNCVKISHGYGYQTLYGHMSKITIKKGQKVKKGQKIGEVGDTGLSTAPHLHYEVHYKGNPINPINFCMDNLTPQEYQQMVNAAQKANQSLD
ncbi:MAG: peptidoglycan DD-metalloendopeptidase family protein [Lewinellaceae bacterium]|nr:peptidoglycan DD-metalloendopeptidase family protein [Saprospiraceae bacterium]MCB9343292.1 peptidoglycan DD-metalloendopeptidase family protein [Lewinellaceae bacterium]